MEKSQTLSKKAIEIRDSMLMRDVEQYGYETVKRWGENPTLRSLYNAMAQIESEHDN